MELRQTLAVRLQGTVLQRFESEEVELLSKISSELAILSKRKDTGLSLLEGQRLPRARPAALERSLPRGLGAGMRGLGGQRTDGAVGPVKCLLLGLLALLPHPPHSVPEMQVHRRLALGE